MSTVDRKRGTKPIYYPESDGQPIGETPIHRVNLSGLIEMLQDHYEDDPSLYISGNMFLYFVEGDPRKVVCPDVFLAFGVGDRMRKIYCTWLEGGKGPDLVVELTSPKTKKEDAGKKFLIYQDVLQVREYFRFDPLDEYLKPPLQGHRLVEGRYVPIEPVDGRLPSLVTGLHFFKDGTDLKLMDPQTGKTFLTLEERRNQLRQNQWRFEEQVRLAEAERLRAEAHARHAEAERLRAEQLDRLVEAERLRAEAHARLAEAEHLLAQEQSRLKEAERLRADQATGEAERLRLELDELRKRQSGGE
jgi:Uma2 family endonuclease